MGTCLNTQEKSQSPTDNPAEPMAGHITPSLKEFVSISDTEAAPKYAQQSMLENGTTTLLDSSEVHSVTPAWLDVDEWI